MPPMTTPGISYEQLQTFLSDLSETIKRVKSQTGELRETREQIGQIDRALRGQGTEPGLIGRFVLLERSLTDLVENKIPTMLTAINSAVSMVNEARSTLQACQLHHDSDTIQVRNEIDRLRSDYQAHLQAEKSQDEKEEKDEAKFGGREWFRQNSSLILVAFVTAVVTVLASDLGQAIVTRIHP